MALFGLLGACGGDDDDGATGSDGAAASDDGGGNDMGDAAVEYAECMREHGIDMPDPEVSGDGRVRIGGPGGPGGGGGMDPNSEDFQAAQEACQPILDEAGGQQGEADPERVAEMQDAAAALGDCMRSRGHEDFEDPQVDSGGRVTQTGNAPPDDPEQFEADMAECEEESGMGDFGGGG